MTENEDESELNEKIVNDLFNSILRENLDCIKSIFQNNEISPWTFKNKDGFNTIQFSCFHNLNIVTFAMIEETKLRTDKQTIQNWINEKSVQGYTPIHYASYRGNIEIIKYLVEYGADINVVNKKGLNVMHLASQGDRPNSLVYFKEYHNINIELRDGLGSTALHWATYTSSNSSLQFLLSFEGINVNAQDVEGYTPLHLSVMAKKPSIIKKLLQYNADRTIKDKKGRNPYDLANDKKETEIAQILMDHSDYSGFCVIKSEIFKNKRSYTNVYIFLILHLFVETGVFFFLIPCN